MFFPRSMLARLVRTLDALQRRGMLGFARAVIDDRVVEDGSRPRPKAAGLRSISCPESRDGRDPQEHAQRDFEASRLKGTHRRVQVDAPADRFAFELGRETCVDRAEEAAR